MEEWLTLAKALSDENRVRTLLFLQDGELCACRIVEMLDIAPSTVSAHMAVLQRARLVEVRKDGRWRHFRLARRSASPLARKLLDIARKTLENDALVVEDEKRLQTILEAAATCAV